MVVSASGRSFRVQRSPLLLLTGLIIGIGLLALCWFTSIALGVADITSVDLWNALFAFDQTSTNHLIIRTVRVPRSLVAVLVGSGMAIAGAIMQGLTRNPIASPSILGVSAGASLAVVLSTFVFGVSSLSVYAWFALVGGAIAAGLMYLFAALGPGGVTPLNLTLSGTVFSTLISTLTSGILILNQQTLEQVRFWLAGSLSGSTMDLVRQVRPFLILGLGLAIALGRHITTLSLGESVAKGLGQNTAWIKGLGAVSVVLLVGSSVSIAGPIGFVGLIVLDKADWVMVFGHNIHQQGHQQKNQQATDLLEHYWLENAIAQSLRASQAGRVYFMSAYLCLGLPGPIGTEIYLKELNEQVLPPLS